MVKESRSNFNQTIQIHRSTMVEKMRRLEGEGRRQPCFVILGGLDVGGVVDIPKGGMTIGRDPGCDLVLKDDGISRFHARVRLSDPESIVIEDRNSTNGTFVAGERVESAVLREGDKVLLGRRTILKFALQDELEESLQRSLFESMARDGLTAAFNRKHFDRKLASDLFFALRHKLPLTLLMLDVDHFKSVNDTYGHPTGDHVLVTLTRAIPGADTGLCRGSRKTGRGSMPNRSRTVEWSSILPEGVGNPASRYFSQGVLASVSRTPPPGRARMSVIRMPEGANIQSKQASIPPAIRASDGLSLLESSTMMSMSERDSPSGSMTGSAQKAYLEA